MSARIRIILIFINLLFLPLYSTAGISPYAVEEPIRISILGDSMTWIGSENCDNPSCWTYYFKQLAPNTELSIYARSGATWTNTLNTIVDVNYYSEIFSDNNVVYNQMMRLKKDVENKIAPIPEIILIYAGANDAWFNEKRPGIFDSDDTSGDISKKSNMPPSGATTLASSVNLILEELINYFDRTTILVVTPVEMSKVTPEIIHRVSDIIEYNCSKFDITTLRADKDLPFSHDQEIKSFQYTSDGVHTNEVGAKLLGNYIFKYLSSYLKIPKI